MLQNLLYLNKKTTLKNLFFSVVFSFIPVVIIGITWAIGDLIFAIFASNINPVMIMT